MKKILGIFIIFILVMLFSTKTEAMTFTEAYKEVDTKPIAVLVYAQWADKYQDCVNAFRQSQSRFVNKYNFVELDIATPDTKTFNAKYNIYPDLPYVLILKDSGKLFRFVKKDCILDNSCISNRLYLYSQ